MRCINKTPVKRIILLSVIMSLLIGLSGCGSNNYPLAYVPDSAVSSYRIVSLEDEVPVASPFAAGLCVINGNTDNQKETLKEVLGAGLFSLSDQNTMYAQNVHEQLSPASLTKILTALVAIKYGSMDTVITASENVKITESGAQVCGIKQGDQLTLSQALHLMMINSANDAAIVVAEGVGGSLDGFMAMMNEEAKKIGATNSNFVNPHGLTDDSHYTTVYDIYLILNEAVKYEAFNQIIQMTQYTTTITTAAGDAREIPVNTTNLYLQGDKTAPEQITVLGGKTGTTNAAGHCLALVCKDTSEKLYISIIMRSDSRDTLYDQMTGMLESEITK